MNKCVEKDIELDLTKARSVKNFDDDKTHGLSHCMKRVDWIVETDGKLLFIEVTDPQDPKAPAGEIDKFLRELKDGRLDNELYYKARDSFLYEWAMKNIFKPVVFIVLLSPDSLSDVVLQNFSYNLKKKVPVDGPPHKMWKQKFIHDCLVMNISLWNNTFPEYPVSRISNRPASS